MRSFVEIPNLQKGPLESELELAIISRIAVIRDPFLHSSEKEYVGNVIEAAITSGHQGQTSERI
jgi:hypothetical protein